MCKMSVGLDDKIVIENPQKNIKYGNKSNMLHEFLSVSCFKVEFKAYEGQMMKEVLLTPCMIGL